MLNKLGDQLTLFEVFSRSMDIDPEILEALFDLLVELVLNSAAATKHFRKHDVQTAVTILTWGSIHSKFAEVLSNISKKIEHLQKLVEANNSIQVNRNQAQLAQSLSALTMNRVVTDESAVTLPCNTLPFFRNPSFYGRKDILLSIGEHLDHAKQTAGIRSAALWGAAGIGKSQIALEFANLQSHTGLQVIIWIDCETNAQISNGFNKAVERLGLPDYHAKNTPDQNRLFMLQWLQKTGKSA
jgi:hypothetical protein